MPQLPPPPEGFEPDPLSTVRSWGVDISSGFRDRKRNKRVGGVEDSEHLNANAVDLTPGKSGLSMKGVENRAREFAKGWPGAKVLNEGDHVHVQLPGWGEAPGLPAPPQGFEPVAAGQPYDGDTVRLQDGRNGRVFGFDAYELNQQGRRRDNSLAPLGKDARDFMGSQVGPDTPINPTGEQSYGRPIISLGTPEDDPARDALRRGHGLAAPEYLRGSPQFGPYMEAERLARINLLGGHGTNAETPKQFRDQSGPWQGAEPGKWGEGQAVFGDEPTPFMGLRPEIEQAYVEVARTAKTAGELVRFGKEHGFVVPAKEASRFIKARDKGAKVGDKPIYIPAPRLATDVGDGATGAAGRGFADPFNMLDELGAIPDTLGVPTFDGERENVWNSERRFGDILWNNIDQNRSILAYDDQEHPYARLGGQIASGVALPYGAGARTPWALARVGAIEGGLAGFGGAEGGPLERVPSAALGTALGTGGGYALGRVATKLPELADFSKLRGMSARNRAIREAGTEQTADGVAAMRMEDSAPELVDPLRQPDTINIGDLPPPPPGFVAEPLAGRAGQMDERLSPEAMAELAEGVDPRSVLPRPGNMVESLDEAIQANPGSLQLLQAPDEMAALGVRQIPSRKDFFKFTRVRGPLDITQRLRTMGGIKDDGGELTHLGITNDPRRMAFGSNEQFLGRLVDNDKGMSLDDATMRLWEEGYFPGFVERPTPADLVDRLRLETMGQRFFHPDDMEEVARFGSAQAERGRIEAAEAEGLPLVEQVGESVTIDDLAANRPPSEAYEEMPRLTGMVGNLNLANIERPQDVAQLVRQISQRVGGFSAGARGKVTNEETRRLAQELGLRPEQLLKRRQGQAINAEELYATRTLVQASRQRVADLAHKAVGGDDAAVATFRKAWLKHVAIEEQLSGATAEAGRALQQFKMLAKAEDAGSAAVRAYLKGAGGKESIEDAAEKIVDLIEDPARAGHFMREGVKPRWRDKFNELWINSLLSGPKTHVVNFAGNAMTTLLSLPEQSLAAGVGKVLRSKDRVLAGEIGARMAGMADSAVDALKAAKRGFITGEPADAVTKVEARDYQAIGGKLGKVIRTTTRALTAADEFWKTINSSAELRAIAYRKAVTGGGTPAEISARYETLVRAPSEDMLKQAQAAARYYTFQKELGPSGKAIQTWANTWPGAKIIVPFVRTPINLLKFAGERSAFGLLMPEVRQALRQGGRARDEALARITLGSGLSTAAVMSTMQGKMSGGGPADPKERASLLQSGWQPYSIKVGHQWVSYARFDPFSTLLGAAADFAEIGRWATRDEADKIALNMAQAIAKNVTNKTWLSGMSDAFEVLTDPERYGGSYVRRLAGSMAVPAVVNQAAQATDPYLRTARTMLDAIKARVPLLSESVPVRRDIWGEPVKRGSSLGPDIASPIYTTKVSPDPVRREIARLRVPLWMPQRFLKIDGRRVDLTSEQYDELVQLTGKPAKQYLDGAVGSAEWRGMNDDQRREEVRKVFEDFRAAARDELKSRYPGLAGDRAVTPPPPPGFSPER